MTFLASLGHPKIRAFVTHGGLLSMYETVYHGVPVVSMPVFCDHDSNAAKAEVDGYAKKLELRDLTSEKLYKAIKEVIEEPKYRIAVMKRQILLRDQKESPLERAVYWTEYVMRHKGAYHLQSPAKDLNYFQYHLLDVVLYLLVFIAAIMTLMVYAIRFLTSRPIKSSKTMKQSLLKHSRRLIDHTSAVKKKL